MTAEKPAKNRAKASAPDDFNGDRAKGRAFLNSCRMYIKLCPEHFADEQAQIIWALSFMKSGRAANLADRILQTEARTRRPFYQGWADFEEAFKTAFCPQNESTIALTKLESTKYYQSRQSVDDYIDAFSSLISEAGYYDGRAIVMKFRRGLDRAIQDKVAEMGRDRPADDDTEAWYAAARMFDENRAANLAFHTTSTTTNHFAPARGFSIRMPPPEPSTTPRTPAPRPSDAVKTRFDSPGVCRRCGKSGHFVKECPMAYDVRYMTGEEVEEWAQQRHVDADIAAVTAREIAPSGNPEVESEDFAPRSE
jgi:hypothetical protein